MTLALDELRAHVTARRELPGPETRRTLRVDAHLSLEQVARAVGVSRQTVSLWETGAVEPRGDHLRDYVRVLKLLRDHEGRARR